MSQSKLSEANACIESPATEADHEAAPGRKGASTPSPYFWWVAGEIHAETMLRGIESSIRWGADIINMSNGLYRPWSNAVSCIYYNAMKKAYNAGIIMVASTGNEGDRDNVYPSAYWEVLSVSGHDMKGSRNSAWNAGDAAIFAPADFVAVASPPESATFKGKSGTSYAAPIVSGAIALGLQRGKVRPHKMEAARDWLQVKAAPAPYGKVLNIIGALK